MPLDKSLSHSGCAHRWPWVVRAPPRKRIVSVGRKNLSQIFRDLETGSVF